MVNPKHIDLKELAQISGATSEVIIKLCSENKLSYLGIVIDPIFKSDNLESLLSIIKAEATDINKQPFKLA